MTVTDQQLRPILAYWSDAAVMWHRDFFDLVASGKPLHDPSDAQACVWVVIQAMRERDATIAELHEKLDEQAYTMSNLQAIADAKERIEDGLRSELAELRKPVAVEPNKLVERIRERNKTGEFNIAYSRQRALDDLLSAYDTLAQNHAREVSAREAIAAKVRWLRQSISSMQLKAAEVADDYCGRLLAAQERERQLQSKIDSLEAQLRNQN